MCKKLILFLVLFDGVRPVSAQFTRERWHGELIVKVIEGVTKPRAGKKIKIVTEGKTFHFTSFPTLSNYNRFTEKYSISFVNDSLVRISTTSKYADLVNNTTYWQIHGRELYYCGDAYDGTLPFKQFIFSNTVDSSGYKIDNLAYYWDFDSAKEYTRTLYDDKNREVEKYHHSASYPSMRYSDATTIEMWKYDSNCIAKRADFKWVNDKRILEDIVTIDSLRNSDGTLKTICKAFTLYHHRDDDKWQPNTCTEKNIFTYNKEKDICSIDIFRYESWFNVYDEKSTMNIEYVKK